MPNCKYCENPFNRARDTKIFCSDKCRVYFNRALATPIENDLSVTKQDSVTDSVTELLSKAEDSVTPEDISVTAVEDDVIYDNSAETTRADEFNPEFNPEF